MRQRDGPNRFRRGYLSSADEPLPGVFNSEEKIVAAVLDIDLTDSCARGPVG